MGKAAPKKLLLIGRQSFAGFSYWRVLHGVDTVMCSQWHASLAPQSGAELVIVDYHWLINLSTKQYIEFLAELTKLPTLVLFDGEHSVDREALIAVGIQAVWSVEELQFVDLKSLLETIQQQHMRLQSIERERQQASQLLSRINSQPSLEHEYASGVTKLLDKEWVQQSAYMLKRARDENKQLQHIAYHDGLTGLVSRDFFIQMVNTALIKAQRQQQRFALIMLDLDHFKSINDTFGHEVGDALLQQVSERLDTLLRDEDVIARLGGDEFAILLMDARSPVAAGLVANKLLRTIHQPQYHIGQYDMQVSASLGIACYPEAGDTYESLMQHADMALYRSKERGRNQYQFYCAETNQHLERKMVLEREIMQSHRLDCMHLVFESVYELSTATVRGLKIMLVWEHETFGMVASDELMPLLSQLPVAVDFDLYALEQLLQFVSSSSSVLMDATEFVLPLSFLSFSRPSIVDDLQHLFSKYDVDIAKVRFMIEGQAWFRRDVIDGTRIHELADMGCRFCWVCVDGVIEQLDAMLRFPLDSVCIDIKAQPISESVMMRVKLVATIAALHDWRVGVSSMAGLSGVRSLQELGIEELIAHNEQYPLKVDQVVAAVESR